MVNGLLENFKIKIMIRIIKLVLINIFCVLLIFKILETVFPNFVYSFYNLIGLIPGKIYIGDFLSEIIPMILFLSSFVNLFAVGIFFYLNYLFKCNLINIKLHFLVSSLITFFCLVYLVLIFY